PFTLAPWEARLQAILNSQGEEEEDKIKELAKAGWAVRIATSSSARNDLVGMGVAIRIPISVARAGKISETFSVTLGTREGHSPYTAELAAIAHGLGCLPEMKYRVIVIVTSNKSAAQAIGNPRQQSGQGHIREIYDAIEKLRGDGNRVNLIWLPRDSELKIQKTAKMSARYATEPYMTPQRGFAKAKTTILNRTRADLQMERKLPDGVGRHSRKVDSALPGKHTRLLYDQLSWKEASVLAQLRTGMARLNGYLYQIRAAPTEECPCGRAKETVEHFLFRCVKWTTQRNEMLQCTEEKRGNLSFHLGGKAVSDGQKWTPDMDAIDKNGGAIAFVDDYTVWVSGPTAQSNRRGIQAIIDKALDWEKRSGATFEAEKTAIIHFTRYTGRVDSEPFTIKGERVFPKDQVKILGVIMDSRLHYKQHIARAATKGLEAAIELKRLKGMAPSTTRQLFTAMVAPVVDYASNVWMHACKTVSAYAIHRVQRIGAQAIIGSFTSVATGVAEAEAHIATIQERFWRRASKLWVDIHTLPRTNPVRNLLRGIKAFRRFISPLRRIADVCRELPKDTMEVIQPFALAPWEARIQTTLSRQGEEEEDKIKELAKAGWAVRIATSSSAKNDLVGMGGAIRIPISVARAGKISETFSVTLGTREEHNPYTAELAAIAHGLSCLPEIKYRVIVILTSNRSAVQAIGNPRQQSGQGHIREIYDAIEKLRRDGNRVNLIWLPANGELKIQKTAKMSARQATKPHVTPRGGAVKAKTTILNRMRADLQSERKLPEGVGKHARKVDSALPGKHTRMLYNKLSWKEASVLAQLRTGMARLNGYLYQIRAAPTGECPCGRAKETVEHFLFRCVQWTAQRKEMMSQCVEEKRGNLSFHLGGKAASDGQKWAPNMEAVRATIRFAIATGRLEQR
ncbi:hypothetical protein BFJ66_g17708, partial [Fusarium oxysporum f. sp. cepae]